MKKSLVFHICGVLCCILMVWPRATCLPLQNLDKQDITVDSRGYDGTDNSQTYTSDVLMPMQPTTEKEMHSMSSYVTSSNIVLAVPEISQNSSSLVSNSTVTDMSPETNNPGLVSKATPTGQTKMSSENRILTTAGSTVVYITSVTSLSEPTKGHPEEGYQPADKNNTDLKQSNLENASLLNTMEMLTTNPRTSIVKTNNDQSTISSHLDDQPLTADSVETQPTTQIPTGLKTATFVSNNNGSIDFTASQISEDWDDTKVTADRSKKVGITMPATVQFLKSENSDTGQFTTSPGMAIPSDDNIVLRATDYMLVTMPEEKASGDFSKTIIAQSVLPQTGLNSIHMATQVVDIVTEMTQSQELDAINTAGTKQSTSDIRENSNVTATATIMDVTSQEDITREPKVTHTAEELAMDSITPRIESSREETNTDLSTTVKAFSAETPATEGLNSPSRDEEFWAGSVSPVMPAATTQTEDTSVLSTVTSASSQVSVILPPTRRISATTAYGADKQEYEEGDEEDEEDEEEDDDEVDEDDEDEEEDDKDNDSVDDSSEKDSDLPLYTLPGLSSQEPIEDDSNVALIEGAAYQVPDTMEWEQQNQGLVRSWMEKLKDKAGYMSGMLIPVGVGIAGALFILGVLYSIRMMNRRRRNGFKRHKRKQREFNSMQDRVMLLADSSEDEF